MMTDPNLYNVGYDVGFEDGFKEAQGRIKELERLTRGQAEQLEIQGNNLAKLSSFGHEQADRIEELEERLKAATDDAKAAEAYAEELEAENKGLRHMILDQINSTGDDPEIMAATRAEWAARALMAEARIKEMEATLKKLEYWFDTDQEILDVMGNNEKADHMRKLKMIRDALEGDSDE